jgi:hypothetical protein
MTPSRTARDRTLHDRALEEGRGWKDRGAQTALNKSAKRRRRAKGARTGIRPQLGRPAPRARVYSLKEVRRRVLQQWGPMWASYVPRLEQYADIEWKPERSAERLQRIGTAIVTRTADTELSTTDREFVAEVLHAVSRALSLMRYGDFNFDNAKYLADRAADRIYFARLNGKSITRKEAILSVMPTGVSNPTGKFNKRLFNRIAKALDRLSASQLRRQTSR